jgi:hypothetical protein
VRQGPFQCSSTLGKRVGGEVTDERRQMGGRSLQCSRARPADGVLVPSRSDYFAIPCIAPTYTVSRLPLRQPQRWVNERIARAQGKLSPGAPSVFVSGRQNSGRW